MCHLLHNHRFHPKMVYWIKQPPELLRKKRAQNLVSPQSRPILFWKKQKSPSLPKWKTRHLRNSQIYDGQREKIHPANLRSFVAKSKEKRNRVNLPARGHFCISCTKMRRTSLRPVQNQWLQLCIAPSATHRIRAEKFGTSTLRLYVRTPLIGGA